MPQLAFAARRRGGTRAHTRTRSNATPRTLKQIQDATLDRRVAPTFAAAATPPRRTHRQNRRRELGPPSLIREASLGIGLGVVFGAVWVHDADGARARRIVCYRKNNPTQCAVVGGVPVRCAFEDGGRGSTEAREDAAVRRRARGRLQKTTRALVGLGVPACASVTGLLGR